MRITLRQLALFVAIARCGNLTQGAQAVFLSQSAGSMALSELEKQLNRPLFQRLGKKLILNEEGKQLLPKAIEILQRAKEIEQPFCLRPEEQEGQLILGASTTIGNYVLPSVISRFLKTFPKVEISLIIGNTDHIIEQIKNFTLDFGFIEGSCRDKNIKVQDFAKDEMVLFCGATHALAHQENASLEDLQQAQWVLREPGSGTREVMDQYFSDVLKAENILLELGSAESIKHFVMQGSGISCLSKCVLEESFANKTLKELKIQREALLRSFSQITHKKKFLASAALAFEQHLQKEFCKAEGLC